MHGTTKFKFIYSSAQSYGAVWQIKFIFECSKYVWLCSCTWNYPPNRQVWFDTNNPQNINNIYIRL